jgi:hypothetical protein
MTALQQQLVKEYGRVDAGDPPRAMSRLNRIERSDASSLERGLHCGDTRIDLGFFADPCGALHLP